MISIRFDSRILWEARVRSTKDVSLKLMSVIDQGIDLDVVSSSSYFSIGPAALDCVAEDDVQAGGMAATESCTVCSLRTAIG
jgi:hypothetical protein